MTGGNELLTKLQKAVAACNEAESNVETARAELVSRSKAVGLLLLEAKKQHPAVEDFEAFLKKVQGLQLSRAYDLMRIAGCAGGSFPHARSSGGGPINAPRVICGAGIFSNCT